jgi:hypothetical protein
MMPANNVHAAMAGQRTSPIDGLNFNRTFPGDPRGTITQQIAAFVTDHVSPRADAFLDLHSGGSSLDLLPSAIVEPTDDAALRRRNIAAAQAFDAPFTVVIDNLGAPHRDGRGLPRRAGDDGNGDGRRRHRARSTLAGALPPRHAQCVGASRRAAGGQNFAAAQ